MLHFLPHNSVFSRRVPAVSHANTHRVVSNSCPSKHPHRPCETSEVTGSDAMHEKSCRGYSSFTELRNGRVLKKARQVENYREKGRGLWTGSGLVIISSETRVDLFTLQYILFLFQNQIVM